MAMQRSYGTMDRVRVEPHHPSPTPIGREQVGSFFCLSGLPRPRTKRSFFARETIEFAHSLTGVADADGNTATLSVAFIDALQCVTRS